MNSEIYMAPELINRLFSKTSHIKNLEIKFEDNKLKLKGKKIFSFKADVKFEGTENNELIFMFEELKMRSIFAKAGLAIGGNKIVDSFAKGELPDFLRLRYPELRFSLSNINISKDVSLTDLVEVIDVKFDNGIRIILK